MIELNCQTIALFPSYTYFQKILEKVMFERTINFLNKYHNLFDNQYGFRQNHSTYMAFLETIDGVSDALDKNNNYRRRIH